MEPNIKIELFIDKRPNGILQPNGGFGTKNANDFYVNVPLNRSVILVDDYVSVVLDPYRTSIKRQLINPYFIELGFFETVNSVSASTVSDVSASIEGKAQNYSITINK